MAEGTKRTVFLTGSAIALAIGIAILAFRKKQTPLTGCDPATEGRARICRVDTSSTPIIVINWENVGRASDRLWIDIRNAKKARPWGENRQLSIGFRTPSGIGGRCSSEFGSIISAYQIPNTELNDTWEIAVGHTDCNSFDVSDQILQYKPSDGLMIF